jgi:flagellar biosynthesis anti-sigma factor FlgM
MDIRDVQPGQAPAPEPGRRIRQGQTSSLPVGGQQGAGDHVTMSDRAHAFQEVRQAALTVPDVRADRVREVRARLAAGRWVPDVDRLARLLIARGVLD